MWRPERGRLLISEHVVHKMESERSLQGKTAHKFFNFV